jgi:leucyl aminopeptidase
VTHIDAFWHFAGLPRLLGKGVYRLDSADFENEDQYHRALLAFGLGAYQFNAYREQPLYQAKLLIPKNQEAMLTTWLSTIYLVRDLINTPTEDMGPSELAEAVVQVAKEFDATVNILSGEALLEEGFGAIYAVGRAGAQPPCLIDLTWGDPNAPKVTLVGKGVCFDSGGLDIKSASGMLLMKKDMGGAAHALGLARMIMWQQLPVRLRLLIPAVENAVDSLSYRPGDVLQTRAGISVEVTNTDAEGRLVLADALAAAVAEDPDYIFDFATLTGAARQALGPQLPAFFCNQEPLAQALLTAAESTRDYFWRLPLYQPYQDYLKSEIADIANSSRVPMAGAITAALFLKRFVSDQIPWAHFDLYAWQMESLPGRPIGADVATLRAVFHYLETQFKG